VAQANCACSCERKRELAHELFCCGFDGDGGERVVEVGLSKFGDGELQVGGCRAQFFESLFVGYGKERERVAARKPLGLDLTVLVGKSAHRVSGLHGLGAGGQICAHDEEELLRAAHCAASSACA
jgi:hypothetical protein